MRRGERPGAGKSAVRAVDEREENRQRPGDEYDALHEVAPHHGLEPAECAVEDGRGAADQDAGVDGGAGHDVERQRGQERHDCDARNHEDHVRTGGKETHAPVEAALKVFVGARDPEAAEKWQIEVDDERREDEDANGHREVAPVRDVVLRRHGEEGDGREHRRENAHAGDVPRDSAAAGEVVAGRLFLAHEVRRHAGHEEEVCGDNAPRHNAEPPLRRNLLRRDPSVCDKMVVEERRAGGVRQHEVLVADGLQTRARRWREGQGLACRAGRTGIAHWPRPAVRAVNGDLIPLLLVAVLLGKETSRLP